MIATAVWRVVVEIGFFDCDLSVFGGVTFYDRRLGDYSSFGSDPFESLDSTYPPQ